MSRSKWLFPYFRRPKITLRRPKFKYIPRETPKILITLAAFSFIFALFAGIIYDIKKEPLPMTSSPLGAPMALTNTLDSQYIAEGIVAAALIFVGVVGTILIPYVKNHLDNPRFFVILLLLGILALVVSIGVPHYMLLSKLPG